MKRNASIRRRPARGNAYILAMILLCVFAAVAAAYTSFTSLNVRKSDNLRAATGARMTAESGMDFMLQRLGLVRLPGNTTQSNFATNLAAALNQAMGGTTNLAGLSVTVISDEVVVPPIAAPDGVFTSRLAWIDTNRCGLVVTGSTGGVARSLSMELTFTPRRAGAFDYGLASRGPINLGGNARLVGVNAPSEASVLSATTSTTQAISVEGNVQVSGDLYAAGADNQVVVSGNPTIAGSKDPAVYAEHIHLGAPVPDFPTFDIPPLAALATYTLQPGDPTNKGTYSNLRIPAGRNPVFARDIVLNGVVYVEAPNVVQFEGKTTLNGFIVTQESTQPLSDCQLRFAGNVVANGVEALPNLPEYSAVKAQPGTFVLAPGFGVVFSGNFSAVNGSIAADQLTFTGTAEGVVKGSVIGLKDLPAQIGGTVDIFVDRTNAVQDPAGFVPSMALEPQGATYTELTGGG